MLFVLSKEKIASYMIAFSTVAILLGISIVNINSRNTIETASNIVIEQNEEKTNNSVN